MQNWKIKRMKDEELKANINACNKFLRTYESGDCLGGRGCLFCDIGYKFHSHSINRYLVEDAKKCNFCLWTIIERERCEEFSQRKLENMVINIKHTEPWQKLRIPMLNQWKIILKVELKRRAEKSA